MSQEKMLIRNLLFAAVAAVVGLCCTGCFTAETWHHLGKTEVIFLLNFLFLKNYRHFLL